MIVKDEAQGEPLVHVRPPQLSRRPASDNRPILPADLWLASTMKAGRTTVTPGRHGDPKRSSLGSSDDSSGRRKSGESRGTMQLLDHLGYGLVSLSSSPDAARDGQRDRSASSTTPNKANFQHNCRSSKEQEQSLDKERPGGTSSYTASCAGKNQPKFSRSEVRSEVPLFGRLCDPHQTEFLSQAERSN